MNKQDTTPLTTEKLEYLLKSGKLKPQKREKRKPFVYKKPEPESYEKMSSIEKMIIDFMEIKGFNTIIAHAIKKDIPDERVELLVSVAERSLYHFLTTGSWVESLSDGVLAEKQDDGKYVQTPEKETERPTVVLPLGLIRDLESPFMRFAEMRKIRVAQVRAAKEWELNIHAGK